MAPKISLRRVLFLAYEPSELLGRDVRWERAERQEISYNLLYINLFI